MDSPFGAKTYLRVRWLHDYANEPVVMFSELDDERWETRKVEVFPNGSAGYADATREYGGTMLGTVPIPSLDAIASDPEFEPVQIDAAAFEEAWKEAGAA
jgi:hypothetical protein